MSIVELRGAARASNRAVEKIGPAIQWQHSDVVGGQALWICLANIEATIRPAGMAR